MSSEPTRTASGSSGATDDEPSIAELVGQLGTQTSTLIRQEMNLAVVEMTGKARAAGLHARTIGIGAGALALGAMTLVASLVLGLAEVMPAWLAALIVGVVLAGGGYAVSRVGVTSLGRVSAKPLRTIETWKDNKAWAKALVR